MKSKKNYITASLIGLMALGGIFQAPVAKCIDTPDGGNQVTDDQANNNQEDISLADLYGQYANEEHAYSPRDLYEYAYHTEVDDIDDEQIVINHATTYMRVYISAYVSARTNCYPEFAAYRHAENTAMLYSGIELNDKIHNDEERERYILLQDAIYCRAFVTIKRNNPILSDHDVDERADDEVDRYLSSNEDDCNNYIKNNIKSGDVQNLRLR